MLRWLMQFEGLKESRGRLVDSKGKLVPGYTRSGPEYRPRVRATRPRPTRRLPRAHSFNLVLRIQSHVFTCSMWWQGWDFKANTIM